MKTTNQCRNLFAHLILCILDENYFIKTKLSKFSFDRACFLIMFLPFIFVLIVDLLLQVEDTKKRLKQVNALPTCCCLCFIAYLSNISSISTGQLIHIQTFLFLPKSLIGEIILSLFMFYGIFFEQIKYFSWSIDSHIELSLSTKATNWRNYPFLTNYMKLRFSFFVYLLIWSNLSVLLVAAIQVFM